jgi:hypothetical protein
MNKELPLSLTRLTNQLQGNYVQGETVAQRIPTQLVDSISINWAGSCKSYRRNSNNSFFLYKHTGLKRRKMFGGEKEKGLDKQTDTTTAGWFQSIGRAIDEKEKENPFSFS